MIINAVYVTFYTYAWQQIDRYYYTEVIITCN